MIQDLPFVKENVPLARFTWFQVGGTADYFVKPQTNADLSLFLTERPQDQPLTILGAASNILIRDGGIKGAVLKLGRSFADINHDGCDIIAGSASLDRTVAAYAQQHGVGGLEFLSGIPGALGGAVAMNAGCYGSEIKDVFLWAEGIDTNGKAYRLNLEDLKFQYRSSSLPQGIILTKICLRGHPDQKSNIAQKILFIDKERKESQPVRGRTGGSTFKNPQGHSAWKLIDDAGCRGLTCGGAQVSEKHCNFLLNLGGASACDLESLGELVKQKVFEVSGINLDWEIKRLGLAL